MIRYMIYQYYHPTYDVAYLLDTSKYIVKYLTLILIGTSGLFTVPT